MKASLWTLGCLALVAVAFLAAQYVASERVEVVVLHTTDASGEKTQTRLWIVEHDGEPFLRAGTPGAAWYEQVQADPFVLLEREGETRRYRAVPRPDLRKEINQLMRRKYTWGDRFISLIINRKAAVPVLLRPADH